jgi:hypothetical protein
VPPQAPIRIIITKNNKVARLGFECLLVGSVPACSISAGIAKKAVRGRTKGDHHKYWKSLTGLRQAKGFLQGLSVRKPRSYSN